MRIAIGSDHAGYDVKVKIIQFLQENANIDLIDCGTDNTESTNYTFFAKKVSEELQVIKSSPIWEPKIFGILICGSGIGMAIHANRYSHIRASVSRSVEESQTTRAHNNANLLCLGARFSTFDQMKDIINAFINTKFEGGRHEKRVLDL